MLKEIPVYLITPVVQVRFNDELDLVFLAVGFWVEIDSKGGPAFDRRHKDAL